MSRFAVSIDAIKQGLTERLDELVAQFFPNAHPAGPNEWVMGDVHGAPGRSLSIRRTGHKRGWWRDFAGTAKGDVLDLFAAGACEGDVRAAIPAAIAWLNLGHLTGEQRGEVERRAERTRAKRAAEHAADAEKQRARARGHWLGAAPIAGTPADRYLLGRAIDIRRLARPPGALRFREMRCPEASTPDRAVMRPCLLACIVHPITGETMALHRTFLAISASGAVGKAEMAEPKRCLGEYAGGFIPLARGDSGRSLKAAPESETLILSEGIEDGLSVAQAAPEMRVGAAISLSNMGGFLLPARLGGLAIAGQRDTKPEAIRALAAARARLAERGIMARVVLPPEAAGVKDWNEWLVRLARPDGREEAA